MKYQIRCTYDTGDTFNEHPGQVQVIDMIWENLDVVKGNLQRIKAHYEYYRAKHAYYWDKEEAKKIIEDAVKQDWYNAKYDSTLNLKADDGKMHKVYSDWCGYFETLKEAEIIEAEPDKAEWKITF
jgi:hypothetical protein